MENNNIEYFGNGIEDMTPDVAIALQKNKWREKRHDLFKELDIEFLISLEKNDEEKKNEIALKKQQLRDVTQTEIPATTAIEILNFWPDILKD
jgi:hypothetical protein